MLAIKPVTSPEIPPPTLIIKSDLLKFLASKKFIYFSIVLMDFDFSLALKYKKNNL